LRNELDNLALCSRIITLLLSKGAPLLAMLELAFKLTTRFGLFKLEVGMNFEAEITLVVRYVDEA
jgi:hypothetical protein